jgi:tetratricopeptide (TPR) repeat protein
MIKLDPEHPAGYLYLATTQWLTILYSMRRLQSELYNNDSFYAPEEEKVDPKLDLQFREAIYKAFLVARVRLRKNPNEVEGLYYLGAAYGVRASYEASVARRFFRALSDGSRGVDNHRKVLKLDPNYADAYLSIGLYDYILGTLPWSIKGLLRLGGQKGNRKQGLKEIQIAMTEGRYTSDDARSVLIALYQREANYSEALKLLEELAFKYPQNYLFRLERAVALGRIGKSNESYDAFDQVLKNERAQAAADLIHYQFGELLFDDGEFSRAIEQFEAVTKTPQANSTLVSRAHLRQGEALDAMNQRSAALEQYNIVLTLENVFDLHNLARRYMKRPYAPEKAARKNED